MTLALRGRRLSSRRRGELLPWLLLIPAGIVILALTGWPLVQLLIMSFQEFGRAQIFGAAPGWIWFENYAKVLGDPTFWVVLGRSILFVSFGSEEQLMLGSYHYAHHPLRPLDKSHDRREIPLLALA